MTKPTKPKRPRPPKPLFRKWVWVSADGHIIQWGATRGAACQIRPVAGERVFQMVEISPAPKRRKGAK